MTDYRNKAKTNVHLPLQQTRGKHPAGVSKGSKAVDNSTCEHAFLTDVADVRQMEQGLLQLLDDFHLGKLQAFGVDCTFEKMDEVRERQERLARLHFDLDSQQEVKSPDSPEGREVTNKNLGKLMGSLQELCSSIHSLQREQQSGST